MLGVLTAARTPLTRRPAPEHVPWPFAQDKGGWRLDHALVLGLRPTASAYAHARRQAGLGDHSALVAELAVEPARAGVTLGR